jgi:hypothetical protein
VKAALPVLWSAYVKLFPLNLVVSWLLTMAMLYGFYQATIRLLEVIEVSTPHPRWWQRLFGSR